MFKYVCLAAIIGTAHMLMGLHFDDKYITIPGMIMMLVAISYWCIGLMRACKDQINRVKYGTGTRQFGD